MDGSDIPLDHFEKRIEFVSLENASYVHTCTASNILYMLFLKHLMVKRFPREPGVSFLFRYYEREPGVSFLFRYYENTFNYIFCKTLLHHQ